MKRKYTQKVYAVINRIKNNSGGYIKDDNGNCILFRTNTKVYFGDTLNEQLLGVVIMTNPGSYKLSNHKDWDSLQKGLGDFDSIDGFGSPDLSMQNIIEVIQKSYETSKQPIPNGYVRILNLSSIICPDGEKAQAYCDSAIQILNLQKSCLTFEEHEISNNISLENYCKDAPFVIIGLLREAFNSKATDIIRWTEHYPNKAFALDSKNWYSHPRRWRTDKNLKQQVIDNLINTINT
jgi:hypothetical protein